VGGAQLTNDFEWPSEQKRSPHLIVSRGHRADGDVDHGDAHRQPASTAMIGFAAH